MEKILLYTIRLIYPPRCTLCEAILPLTVDKLMCYDCQKDYPFIQEPLCPKCGKQVITEDTLCDDCKITTHFYEKGIALYPYEGTIKETMYRFKYGGRKKYAQLFGQMLAKQLQNTNFPSKIDLIVPVPISKERIRQRGYNQAEEIAKYVSKYIGIPYNKDILIRTTHTKPQSSFSPMQRRKNIKSAFKCTGTLPLETKVILIIDDIYTTGSTIDECAKTLKKSGAQVIYSAVVCIGNSIIPGGK